MLISIVTACSPPKVMVSNALMVKNISGVGQGIFLYLLALGEEGSEHDGARSVQVLAAEVSFGRAGLHRDAGCLFAEGDGL